MIKYKMNVVSNMLQFLKMSLNQIKCALTYHEIAQEDEDALFNEPTGTIETICARCNYPLLLRRDPTDREEGTYMIVER
jgi:hypothetical protein